MKKIENLLSKIGFNTAEKKIYLYLLENNIKTIKQLTHLIQIPRSSVDLACNELYKLGIIHMTISNNKKQFFIKNIADLNGVILKKESEIIEHKNIIASLLPELKGIQSIAQDKEHIHIENYEGEDGLVEVFNLSLNLRRGQEVTRFSMHPDKFIIKRDKLSTYGKKRRQKGINTRFIVPESKHTQSEKKDAKQKNREIRTINQKIYNPNVHVQMWGNYTAFTVWDKGLDTIVIHNKKIAEFMNQIFEITWKTSKK